MAFHIGVGSQKPLLIGQYDSGAKIKPSFDFGNPYGSGGSEATDVFLPGRFVQRGSA